MKVDDAKMCNKYKEFSKVDLYEKKELVDKCNAINFDFTGKIKHEQCLRCRESCKDIEFNLTGECNNFTERMSLKEINKEIRRLNINVKRECKKNNLKYGKMKDMLLGKRHMKFSYYKALEDRIMEKEEYIKYYD